METKAPREVSGFEYDWLASDADGYVALFSTAGGGFAPMPFLRNPDAHQMALDELLAGPASTTARFAPEFPAARQNTWRLVAERGLYAYDSDVHGGEYGQGQRALGRATWATPAKSIAATVPACAWLALPLDKF